MTLKPKITLCIASMLWGVGVSSTCAQDVNATFESSTAVLDTSVLFAIGAREAEQAIRGSFGWPTFQEGFVESVYFRFDPDGYARFSPSPRLDEDVFEIQCVQNGAACIARKNGIEVGLTPEGRVQIRFDGITPSDSFFVSDRKSELPLPPTILEPLDARLETLLSSSSELIIKRELEVLQNISLVGFSAVTTYLRWVAQGQSPRVFPRGWPVPAQSGQIHASGLTQPSEWETTTNAPQVAKTTWHLQSGNQPPSNTFQNGSFSVNTQSGANTQSNDQIQSEFQAMKEELARLRGNANQQSAFGDGNETWALQNDHGTVFGNDIPSVGQHNDIVSPNYGALKKTSFGGAQMAPVQNQNNYGVDSGINGYFSTSLLPPQNNSQDQGVVLRRVMALEAKVEQLHQLLSATTKYENSGVIANAGMSSEYVQSTTPADVNKTSGDERIKVLENLLLQRLAPDKPVLKPTSVVVEPVKPQEKMEQELIEEMLRKLDSGPPEVSASIESGSTAELETKNDEYVTLSDYLNRVLKNNASNEN